MERLVFYHIPKCGGTSVHVALSRYYTRVCPVRNYDLENLCSEDVLNHYTLISGAFPPSMVHRLVKKPYKEVILLRDPIERIISMYWYARSHKWSWIERNVLNSKAEAYRKYGMNYYAAKTYNFKTFLEKEYEYLKDDMILRISSDTVLFFAQEMLHKMDVVGTLDNIRPFMHRVYDAIGVENTKATPHELKFEELTNNYSHCELIKRKPLTPDIFDLLLDITENDMILYKYAKELSYAKSITN